MLFNRREGFTLIEVVAVMAVMLVAAAIAVPVLDGPLDDARLYTDARQMANVLRSARQQAISSMETTTVIFYPASARYKVAGKPSSTLQSGVQFVGGTTFTTRLGSMPTCVFAPTGAPGSGGTGTLTNGHKLMYVIVNPVAGRVRLSETPPDGW